MHAKLHQPKVCNCWMLNCLTKAQCLRCTSKFRADRSTIKWLYLMSTDWEHSKILYTALLIKLSSIRNVDLEGCRVQSFNTIEYNRKHADFSRWTETSSLPAFLALVKIALKQRYNFSLRWSKCKHPRSGQHNPQVFCSINISKISTTQPQCNTVMFITLSNSKCNWLNSVKWKIERFSLCWADINICCITLTEPT